MERLPPLDAWSNFYVIVGSSAAALTGLTFVVIALASDAKMVRLSGLRTFITPIVMHFGSVLWIAALLCIPGQTAASMAVCMSVSGAVMTAYGLTTTYRMYRGRRDFRPMIQDWIWNATLPTLCSVALLTAGVLAAHHPAPALLTIGAVALALLFIGIHNAWDLAVWITAERPSVRSQQEAGGDAAGGASTPSAPTVTPSLSTPNTTAEDAAGAAAVPREARR